MHRFIWFVCVISTLIGCDLEREIDLELPPYEVQPVVEAYLKPGSPYRLLLTVSSDYFGPLPDLTRPESFDQLLIEDAAVQIRHQGEEIELTSGLSIDFADERIFNYSADEIVPENYDDPFELDITLANGQTITATTRIVPVVPIDSLVVEFDEERDTLARVLTYVTDPSSTENFYRRMSHFGSLDSLEQDFITNDRFVDNDLIVFGTNYEYEEGDTVITSLFHLAPDYYEFLESVFLSLESNGNPFGQPSTINSNLEGTANAIGIFTGYGLDRRTTIITR